jgi:hypothetical protein
MNVTSNASTTSDNAPRTIAYLDKEINPQKTATVRELGPVDVRSLTEAVLALPADAWDKTEDFEANYNKNGAIRSASHVIFRFCDRRQIPFRYFDMPVWDSWQSLLLPVMEGAVKAYGYTRGFYPRIMLAKLPGGTFIPPHIDGQAHVSVPHKIHVPLITNAQTFFFVDTERFHLAEGIAYEVNNATRHSVVNGGESERIHLIFEYLDAELQQFHDDTVPSHRS